MSFRRRAKALRRRLKVWGLLAMSRLPRSIRDPMILKQIKAEEELLGNAVVKIAETEDEHHQAAQLLFHAYAEADLVQRHGVPVRVTSYLMLPTTVRFVAMIDGEVVATLSLVQDSELGLPLEHAYADAVKDLRTRSPRIAEIGALAVKRGFRGHGLTMLLYKAMWKTAAELLDVKHLVVAVRPEAAMFYESALLFKPLATVSKRYPGINSNSTSLQLDLTTSVSLYRQAFGHLRQKKQFNPLVFFVESEHPVLQLPKSKEALEALQETHQVASMRLAWLRPESVMGLDSMEFKALEDALARPSP